VDVEATKKIIEENKAKNTIYKTKSDLKVFNEWAQIIGETIPVETIPVE